MLFPEQGATLLDPRYEYAIRQLPEAQHHRQRRVLAGAPPSVVARERTAAIASAVRTRKELGDSYFVKSVAEGGGDGQLHFLGDKSDTGGSGGGGAVEQLMRANMTYQAHLLRRERQLASYVRSLERDEAAAQVRREELRNAALADARAVDRLKLQQSARARIALQQRAQQDVPAELLTRHGLDASCERAALTAARTKCAEERQAARDLPRQALTEFHLPRLVESALCRQERIAALHDRAAQRVALESRVGTGFAVKRSHAHELVRQAREAAGLDTELTPGRAARCPGLAELRDARELAARQRLAAAELEREQRTLWAEMAAIDEATERDAKAARRRRNPARPEDSD
jgi:hypothetical protein